MHGLTLVLFAISAGFTASSIAASLYRMVNGAAAAERRAVWVRSLVMIIAGPNLVLDASVKSLAAKKCSAPLFWCALAGIAYWSMALGLFVLDIAATL